MNKDYLVLLWNKAVLFTELCMLIQIFVTLICIA